MYSYIQIEENITYFRLPFSNEKVRIYSRWFALGTESVLRLNIILKGTIFCAIG